MTIDLRVLKNPCVNKGMCQGPESDPKCQSTNRIKGKTIGLLQMQRFHFRSDILYHHEYCGIIIKVIGIVLISYAYAQVMQLTSNDKDMKY